MSQIKVELVDKMGDDLAVANAARVSFNKYKDEFEEGKDDRLINFLAANAHTSPFRHTAVSIRCSAPVFLARQLGKHQAGLSWNEVSRRYVDVGIEFFVPDSWRSRPVDGIKQGSGETLDMCIYHGTGGKHGSHDLSLEYVEMLKELEDFYNRLLGHGVAPEMARMVLPQAMMVDWIWTGNLLSMFHIYRLRSGEGAQVEAKDFAEKLQDVVQPLFPHCWGALKDEPL